MAHRWSVLMLGSSMQHWIDPTSLEQWSTSVVDRIAVAAGPPRDHGPAGVPAAMGRRTVHVSAMSLDRFNRDQSAVLAERVTGGKKLPPDVLEQIVARTDGVPLFVEELTKTVLESGLLRDAGDRYLTTGPLPPPAIPSTLHDSLMARLDRSAPMREVAQIGAAIGREFPHDLLAAVAPTDTVALDGALAELVASGLASQHGTLPHAVYTFKHALVQDAAYQSLLKSRRQPLHARIADVLERRFPDTAEAQPELLARHLAEAGQPARAIGYWRQASERALARSGTKEALAHLDSGLAALEGLPQGAERQRLEVELRLTLGQTLRAARGTAAPETEAAFGRARKVCEQSGDDAGLTQALHGLALCHYNRADLGVADATGSEFLALAERAGDPEVLRQANEILGASRLRSATLPPRGHTWSRRQRPPTHLRQQFDPDTPEHARLPGVVALHPGLSGSSVATLPSWPRSPPFSRPVRGGDDHRQRRHLLPALPRRHVCAPRGGQADRARASEGDPLLDLARRVLTRLGAQRGGPGGGRAHRDAAGPGWDAILRLPHPGAAMACVAGPGLRQSRPDRRRPGVAHRGPGGGGAHGRALAGGGAPPHKGRAAAR